MATTEPPPSPFTIELRAATLRKRWDRALDRFDKCTEASWYDRAEDESTARSVLDEYISAHNLHGTEYDPTTPLTTGPRP